MKTFKTIGMACLAIVASINFTACGDEEDDQAKVEENLIKNEDGIITNRKRLTEVKTTYGYEENPEIHTFSYDNKGRLISVTEDTESGLNTTLFTWENGTIKTNSNTVYTLTNNLIRKQEHGGWNGNIFTYNSSGQLIKMEGTDAQNNDNRFNYTFTWNNGKITKIVCKSNFEESIREFTYSGKTCKGWLLPDIIDENLDYILWVHPELVGMYINLLPAKMSVKYTYDDGYSKVHLEEEIELMYALDKDGYVTHFQATSTCVEAHDEDGDNIFEDKATYTYTAFWVLQWE